MKTLIIILLIILLLSGCSATVTNNTTTDYIPEVKYYIIYIEEMPCLYLHQSTTSNGITCDWSKWEGK